MAQTQNSQKPKHEHVFIFNDSECFSCGKTKWELGLDPSAIANEEVVSDGDTE